MPKTKKICSVGFLALLWFFLCQCTLNTFGDKHRLAKWLSLASEQAIERHWQIWTISNRVESRAWHLRKKTRQKNENLAGTRAPSPWETVGGWLEGSAQSGGVPFHQLVWRPSHLVAA